MNHVKGSHHVGPPSVLFDSAIVTPGSNGIGRPSLRSARWTLPAGSISLDQSIVAARRSKAMHQSDAMESLLRNSFNNTTRATYREVLDNDGQEER